MLTRGSQVGYKYRFFGEDATAASGVLNIFAFADRNFLVCGGPTHRGALYVRRLVEAGHKVGVVRQSETAALKAAGDGRSKLFERKLGAVYTRATIAAGVALDGGDAALGDAPRVSSYLVALAEAPAGSGTQLALVAVETSTGDVACGEFRDGPLRAALESHLLTLEPGEVLLVGDLAPPTEKLVAGLCGGGAARIERASADGLLHGAALAELTQLCASPAGADTAAAAEAEVHVQALMQMPELLCVALAAASRHLAAFGLARVLRRCAAFRPLDSAGTMTLPPNALRQLDVLAPSGGAQGAQGSLLWLLNHARTPMGKRAVQRWVARPLRSRDAIDERLGAVAALLEADESRDAAGGDGDASPLAALAPALAKLPDVERCLTRALHRTATPGEFVAGLSALADASARLAPAAGEDAQPLPADARLRRRLLAAAGDPAVAVAARALVSHLDASAASARPPDLARLFLATDEHADPDAAGGSADAGRLPGTGFPAVDAARREIATAEASLAELLPGLRRELRLPRLEYVRVSEVDYLLEVPDGVPVPAGWLKHSSLKSRKLSRWHAPAVSQLVEALQRGRESLDAAARSAWDAYLARFAEAYAPLRAAADALGQLDALRALATLSRNPGYVRPLLLSDDAPPQLHVVAGRHPMLDAILDGAFVPNDTHLSADGVRCCAITGPNMGGKSVYIRQTALIALLAHIGCYVPAASASLTVCDGIFTRMGASDSLATGSSTFLEEMSEASAILRTATPRSLVILDELGRGTATVDGCAIATATLAHLAGDGGPLTLFVTHFPSVAREVSAALPRAVASMHVSYNASETSREAAVTFLYKLVPGVAPSSFGLNVARMAGLPPSVVARAVIKADEAERVAQPAGAPLAPALEDALRAALRATDAGQALQARAAAAAMT